LVWLLESAFAFQKKPKANQIGGNPQLLLLQFFLSLVFTICEGGYLQKKITRPPLVMEGTTLFFFFS
jgi:hypothetical protein